MTSKIKTYICFVMISAPFMANICNAYETGTHARMTKMTYIESDLFSEERVLENLGLVSDGSLGQRYYDVVVKDNIVHERSVFNVYIMNEGGMPTPTELGNVGFSEGDNDEYIYSAVGWMMRGAIREDDFDSPLFNTGIPCGPSKTPQDDPYGNFIRVANHFYDPYYKTGLGEIAPDWAIGLSDSLGVFGTTPTENRFRRNHFTLLDARETMYRALTGRRLTPFTSEMDKYIGPNGQESNAEIRKAYWATMFRSLGDVTHLLQDMAQPQHTRNDLHPICNDVTELVKSPSVYEAYIEERAREGGEVDLGGSGVENMEALTYTGYPVPNFSKYVTYFSSGKALLPDVDELQEGNGLADFSNRGFFSAGTNLGSNEYQLPVNDRNQYVREPIDILTNTGQMTYYLLEGDVLDNVGPSESSVPLTTESIWSMTSQPYYSLNRYNYDAAAEILIPRAVSYGAGLVNHFFRGRLDIGDAGEGIWSMIDHSTPHYTMSDGLPINSDTGKVFGFTKVRMTVRNDTPPIETPDGTTIPQDMTDGFLQAVVKYNLNYCYEPDLKGQFPPDAFDTDGTVPLDDGSTYSGCNGYRVLLDQSQPDPGVSQVEDQVEKLGKVSVSKRIAIGPSQTVQELSHTTDRLIEFDFRDDPIPINAREVRLQVLYRGKLGSGDAVEEDAIAVETADIREPTYWTYINDTDYVRINGTLMTHDVTISALNTYISQATDDEERDALIDFRDGLTDPSVPLTDFTCESRFGDISKFVTAEEIPVKHFVRVALLTNMDGEEPFADNSQMGDCQFVRTRTDGQTHDVTAYYFGHTVKNHTDQFQRDDDVFLFGRFPLFRNTVLKQGGENFYDAFGWGEFHDERLDIDQDYFPETVPADKEQEINDALIPEPVPVELDCNYTWKGCA